MRTGTSGAQQAVASVPVLCALLVPGLFFGILGLTGASSELNLFKAKKL
jgi:hypothetical protein